MVFGLNIKQTLPRVLDDFTFHTRVVIKIMYLMYLVWL